MKLYSKYPQFFGQVTVYFSTAIRIILNLLLIIIVLALLIGVTKAGIDLYRALHQPLEIILQNILLDTVFIVALLEIGLTILAYLKDGSVHVRYIIDTILIIMLNEIVGAWFHEASFERIGGLCLIIATLVGARIVALKYGQAEYKN